MESPIEHDQMVSVEIENYDLDTSEIEDFANMETDVFVNMEDHDLDTLEIDDLANWETDEFVNVEDNDLDQLVNIEENDELEAIEDNQLDDMATPPSDKRMKKKSMVWEYFTIETVSARCKRARCKQSFSYSMGSKLAGTSHLKRLVAKGTCSAVLRNQTQVYNNDNNTPDIAPSRTSWNPDGINPPKRQYSNSVAAPFLGFDSHFCRHEITRMVIMQNYPLHIDEHPGFIAFVKSLQPKFDTVILATMQHDCVTTYLTEKQSLQKFIETIPVWICLTVDMWGWNLTTGFSHAVAACLSDWNIEGRLFTVTLNQPLNEGSIDNLQALLSIRSPLVLNGQLVIGSCLACSLSGVTRAALSAACDTVAKVRHSVKYARTLESCEEMFLEVKQQLQFPSTKILALDDRTQWNTTCDMLISVYELKDMFSCLGTSNPDYEEAPWMEIWKQIETLCTFLKLLFETASILSAPSTPTANANFHEVWKIQLELVRAVQSEDPFMSSIAKVMKDTFDEYWKNCFLVLAIAIIMDSRFKMKLVDFNFSKISSDDAATYVKIVDEGIHEIYLRYVPQSLPVTPTFMDGGSRGNLKNDKGQGGLFNDQMDMTDFDTYIMQATSHLSRTELDQYLEESVLPRVQELDVVGWWKINNSKYPTLSNMARDILTIPVCMLSPGSVFNMESRMMEDHRCSRRPETMEALICAKDWLKREPVETSSSLEEMDFSN